MYFNKVIYTERIKLCIGSSMFREHLTWLQSERGRSGKKVKSKDRDPGSEVVQFSSVREIPPA